MCRVPTVRHNTKKPWTSPQYAIAALVGFHSRFARFLGAILTPTLVPFVLLGHGPAPLLPQIIEALNAPEAFTAKGSLHQRSDAKLSNKIGQTVCAGLLENPRSMSVFKHKNQAPARFAQGLHGPSHRLSKVQGSQLWKPYTNTAFWPLRQTQPPKRIYRALPDSHRWLFFFKAGPDIYSQVDFARSCQKLRPPPGAFLTLFHGPQR